MEGFSVLSSFLLNIASSGVYPMSSLLVKYFSRQLKLIFQVVLAVLIPYVVLKRLGGGGGGYLSVDS